MIDRFVAALYETELELDWRDIADVLWLADVRARDAASEPARAEPTAESREAGGPATSDAADSSPVSAEPVGLQEVTLARPVGWRLTDRGDADNSGGAGLEAAAPTSYALPGRMEIGRALRPMKQRRRTPRRKVFDPEATVDLFCDTGVLVPVLRAGLERWFDVAIVADTSATMAVWDDTVAALADLLERHGAFRGVTRWALAERDGAIEVVSQSGFAHRPHELLDLAGRRLVLVVTDAVDALWARAPIWEVLRAWGEYGPVALVQVLPPRSWAQTRLGEADAAVAASRPGQPNHQLEVVPPWWWLEGKPPDQAVPVIGLDEASLSPWARMVMGAPGVSVPGVLAAPEDDADGGAVGQASLPGEVDLDRLGNVLRSTVSAQAYRLAVLLSAVEVSLPIARIVMHELMPHARLAHLAELIAAGVLKADRLPAPGAASDAVGAGAPLPAAPPGGRADRSHVALTFAPGLRELLQRSLTVTMTLQVWRAVAPYLEATHGLRRFSLLLQPPHAELDAAAGAVEFREGLQAIAADLADRLGLVPSPVADWPPSSEPPTVIRDSLTAAHDSASTTNDTLTGTGRRAGGVALDRVVAVVTYLDSGIVQIGSGYLVTETRVLTARNCIADSKTGRPPRSLKVARGVDTMEVPATLLAVTSDVAVLSVADNHAWAAAISSEPPHFGRIDRSRVEELRDCAAVGFPLLQMDSQDQRRRFAELHGTIRTTEGVESGLLVMRDLSITPVVIHDAVAATDRAATSPSGGLSGALVFYQGQGIALGVIIEDRPLQGSSAIGVLPLESFAAGRSNGDPDSTAVAEALGLPPADTLPLASERPLAEMVQVSVHGRLPRVTELDPYTLGATPSQYGNANTYGQRDPYVPRSKDARLATALRPGRLVVVAGPANVGKTRTAFESIRGHDDWGNALLAAPIPQAVDQLARHPALGDSRPLVIWLDDLERFLSPTGKLSQATISRLLERPGPTVLLATLRSKQRDLLQGADDLTRQARMVLDSATFIELASTQEDPRDRALAAKAYPPVGSQPEGLAEGLAAEPLLLRRYLDAVDANPTMYTLVQVCVDWARCGLGRPVPELVLFALTRDTLAENFPNLDLRDDEMDEALRRARTPIVGQIALLSTRQLPDKSRGYAASDYLIAADDGQFGMSPRSVTDTTWRRVLDRATDEDALHIGIAADQRHNVPVAVTATRRAAEAGHTDAQYALGVLLATVLDPPDLAGARAWYTKAAEAGHTGAQYALGALLADRLDPPDLAGARAWYTKAAEAGHTGAQYALGALLADRLDPPDLAGARALLTRAAEAGNTDAQTTLGVLLADRLDPPDLAGARAWLTRAAEAGNTGAQYALGVLLATVLDPPDLAGARAWYTKAAEAGHTGAQYALGMLLATVLDPPDLAGTRAWYTKAAEAGHTGAQYALGVLLATMLDPPELAGARAWLTRAAEAGNTDAQTTLAALLADRLDPPELAGARAWYTKAAEAGHTGAQYALGALLANRLDPPELAEARAWYTKAAEAGNTDARNALEQGDLSKYPDSRQSEMQSTLRENERQIEAVLRVIEEGEQTPDTLERNRVGDVTLAAYLYSVARTSRNTVRGVAKDLHEAGWTREDEERFIRAFENLVDVWTTYQRILGDLEDASRSEGPSPNQILTALENSRRRYIGALDSYRVQLLVALNYVGSTTGRDLGSDTSGKASA